MTVIRGFASCECDAALSPGLRPMPAIPSRRGAGKVSVKTSPFHCPAAGSDDFPHLVVRRFLSAHGDVDYCGGD